MKLFAVWLLIPAFVSLVCAFPRPPPHPRLFILDSELPLIHDAIVNDPVAASWYQQLTEQGEAYLAENATVIWTPGRVLSQSRAVLWKVTTLGGLYRLTQNMTYAQRAIKEMMAAAAFPGWDPVSFIDTAEMINALSIGHDWFYYILTEEEKQTITTAIYEKGFHFGLEYFNGNWTNDPTLEGGLDWTEVDFNWNTVCNGGLIVGAISLWEVYPDVAQELINYAVTSLPYALASYGPDGGWYEGPMYWQYATNYLSYGIGSLLSAFGNDFGLLQRFSAVGLTGNYRIHTLSPSYAVDNYADCDYPAEYAWCMIFLGRLYNNSLFLSHERLITQGNFDSPSIFHLFYSRAEDKDLTFPTTTPLDDYFRGVEVVAFRTSWEMGSGIDYIYGAIKGGDTTQNHQDLDLGHFIIEKNGQRLIEDLGSDNYSLYDYFVVPERYQYYRTNTSGHNTLNFNGNWNQQITQAIVINYTSTPEEVYAEIDLSKAYNPNATSVHRSLLFDRANGLITISDQIITNPNTQSVAWRFQTQANITGSGNQLELSVEGVSLVAKIITPNLNWTVYPYYLEPPFAPAPNLQVVQIDVPIEKIITVQVQFE